MTLQDLLGVDLPVIQAPMAGAHVGALAIAVGQAGALGSLPCAMLGPSAIRREIGAIRAALPSRPFNLNFFCHRPPVPDLAREAAWRSALAPYYREFGLEISAMRGKGNFNFAAIGNERSRRLQPEERFLRQRLARLTGVVGIIQPDGNDLRGIHRGERPQPLDLSRLLIEGRRAEHVPL